MAQATHPPAAKNKPSPRAPTVLVLDANEDHQALSVTALGRHGYRVMVSDNLHEGLRVATEAPVDVIVIAQKLRGTPGFDALRVFAERLPDTPKVFVVTGGQEDLAVRALDQGASGYLVKTARYNELLPAAVKEQLTKVRVRVRLQDQEKALEEVEARFRDVVEAADSATFSMDPEGGLADVSERLCLLLGTQREALLRAKVAAVLQPAAPGSVSFDAWVRSGAKQPLETSGTRADGSRLDLEVTAGPVRGADEARTFVVRDVTARKEAEKALEKMRARLATLASHAPIVLFASDAQGVITVAEGKALADIGLRPEDLLGRQFSEVLGLERPEMMENVRRVLEEGESGAREVVFRGRIFESTFGPLREPDGAIAGAIAVGVDVTDKRAVDAALRRRDAILEATRFAAEHFLAGRRWEDVIPPVLERLGRATGVSRIWIFQNVVQPDGSLRTHETFEWDADGVASELANLSGPPRSYDETGFTRWETMLGKGEAIVGHTKDAPESERPRLSAQGVRSVAVVPIFVGPRWWGHMGYDQCDRERDWSVPEVEALKTAAGILGTAIQRAEAERAVGERARQQAAVAAFGQRALAVDDVNELIREATAVAAQTLGVEYSGVVEVAPTGDALLFRGGVGWDPSALGRRMEIRGSELARGFAAILSGSTSTADMQGPAGFGFPDLFREVGLRSGMSALIRVHGKPLGVLAVHTTSLRTFTEDDVHFLEAIANTMATAMDRIRADRLRYEALEGRRAVIDSSPAAIIGIDAQGRVTLWNHAAERVFGWASDEVVGRQIPIIPPGKEGEHVRLRMRVLGGEAIAPFDTIRCRKDGRLLDVETSLAPIFDSAGKATGAVGVLTDITERKRGERLRSALYKISEAANATTSLEDLYEEIHRIVAELMPAKNFYITLYDPATETLSFPYFRDEEESTPPPQPLGKGLTEYVLRTGRPLLALPYVFDGLVRSGEVESVGPPSVDWLGVPLTAMGRTIGVLVVQSYTKGVRYQTQDRELLEFVSDQIAMAIERKRAEEAARESAERYRVLFEANPQPMWVWDAETLRFLAVNDAAIRHYGYTSEEFLGMTIKDIRPAEDVPRLVELTSHLGPGISTSGQWRHRTKDGTVIDVEVVSHNIDFGGRNARLVLATDVTERRKAEEQLARSERRFRALFESSLDGIVLVDGGGLILDANSAAEAILDAARPSLVGRSLNEVFGSTDPERVRDLVSNLMVAGSRPTHSFLDMVSLNGGSKSLEIWGQRVAEPEQSMRFAVVIEDVSERKRMERRLVETERQASLGSMAGYVAHEINTPLANISLLVAAARRKTKDAELLEKLEKIDAQRRHASSIISDILSFSKQRETQRAETDLRKVVEIAADQVLSHRREGVRFELALGEAPVLLLVDPLQMQEVVSNLLKNAFEATSAGTVTIAVEDQGDKVLLRVEDTGTGITPEDIDRLFQPFFTTKQNAGGTGLGLVLCQNVVSAHGGEIHVSSATGKGSVFTVTIPRRDSDEDPRRG